MKNKLIEKLKFDIISTYLKIGDDPALVMKNKRSYTGNELAKEISDETDFGIDLVNNLIQLTIDLLKRDKLKL